MTVFFKNPSLSLRYCRRNFKTKPIHQVFCPSGSIFGTHCIQTLTVSKISHNDLAQRRYWNLTNCIIHYRNGEATPFTNKLIHLLNDAFICQRISSFVRHVVNVSISLKWNWLHLSCIKPTFMNLFPTRNTLVHFVEICIMLFGLQKVNNRTHFSLDRRRDHSWYVITLLLHFH